MSIFFKLLKTIILGLAALAFRHLILIFTSRQNLTYIPTKETFYCTTLVAIVLPRHIVFGP